MICTFQAPKRIVQVFAEVAAALNGEPPPAAATLRQAVRDLERHAGSLAEWTGNEKSAVLQMRKFVPLYLSGFDGALDLRKRLLRACNMNEYHAAAARDDWNGSEIATEDSARMARLKAGRLNETSKVALPHLWLDDRWGYANFDVSDAACEG